MHTISPYAMPCFNEVTAKHQETPRPSRPDAEAVERDAYEKGYAAGEQAGFAMGEQKALVVLGKLENLLLDLATLRAREIRTLESKVVEVACAIARKIILRELAASPETVVEITKEALLRLERTGHVTIKVNASLYDLFLLHRPQLLAVHPDIGFEVDAGVGEHGSIIIGPTEEVSTDLEEQVEVIRDSFRSNSAGD